MARRRFIGLREHGDASRSIERPIRMVHVPGVGSVQAGVSVGSARFDPFAEIDVGVVGPGMSLKAAPGSGGASGAGEKTPTEEGAPGSDGSSASPPRARRR